jgi:hypothetical protein
MKTNFILIDFENVQPEDLSLLRGSHFNILVFVGVQQTKLPRALVFQLQSLGDQAQYVAIEGSGRNALDFHLAYYLGQLAAEHPGAGFHIISKDTGFDLLIKHLKTKKVTCQRCSSLNDIPGLRRASVTPGPSPVKVEPFSAVVKKVMATLTNNAATRPRTLKKLRSFMKPFLGTQATDAGISELVEELGRRGVFTVTEAKVTYPGP